VASLLQSLKSKTISLKELYLVRKATYAVDYGFIKIRLKACYTFSLINTNDLANRSSVFVIKGSEYRSFLVKAFN
jgi:hypothetical protein